MPLAVSALLWRSCCYLAATCPISKLRLRSTVLALPLRRLAAVLSQLHAPEINGTLYAFFGMEDASIPPEQVDQIEAELKSTK